MIDAAPQIPFFTFRFWTAPFPKQMEKIIRFQFQKWDSAYGKIMQKYGLYALTTFSVATIAADLFGKPVFFVVSATFLALGGRIKPFLNSFELGITSQAVLVVAIPFLSHLFPTFSYGAPFFGVIIAYSILKQNREAKELVKNAIMHIEDLENANHLFKEEFTSLNEASRKAATIFDQFFKSLSATLKKSPEDPEFPSYLGDQITNFQRKLNWIDEEIKRITTDSAYQNRLQEYFTLQRTLTEMNQEMQDLKKQIQELNQEGNKNVQRLSPITASLLQSQQNLKLTLQNLQGRS